VKYPIESYLGKRQSKILSRYVGARINWWRPKEAKVRDNHVCWLGGLWAGKLLKSPTTGI